LAFISLIFIFVALALGLLISTVVESQMAAMLVSGMGLMMPVMILSGMMFPIESMPNVLQWISALVPARWYISAVRKIMIQGVGIENAWLELTVLFVMAFFLILLSLKKFKVRLN
jgi:ABC-2 type transport system permease protein